MRHLTHIHLGLTDYNTAAAMQDRLVDSVLLDPAQAFLVTVEHPPVITLGRRGQMEHVVVDPQQLAAMGIEVRTSSRGGQVTYHGPGQLVAYPIWQLARGGRSVHGHVHLLARAAIETLGAFGIAAGERPDAIGVYVDHAKIAAIGVAVRRWVCYHGIALNVEPDLSHFDTIVPCGDTGGAVASMASLLDGPVDMADVRRELVARITDVCCFDDCHTISTHSLSSACQESHV